MKTKNSWCLWLFTSLNIGWLDFISLCRVKTGMSCRTHIFQNWSDSAFTVHHNIINRQSRAPRNFQEILACRLWSKFSATWSSQIIVIQYNTQQLEWLYTVYQFIVQYNDVRWCIEPGCWTTNLFLSFLGVDIDIVIFRSSIKFIYRVLHDTDIMLPSHLGQQGVIDNLCTA